MGLFSSECSQCGSKEHATSDCPHGIFSSECSHCGSKDHASSDCPHGIFSSKCSLCGSTEHSSSNCPHGIFSSQCSNCGSKNHSSTDCPHGILGKSISPSQETNYSSSSGDSGCGVIIGWLIGIIIAVVIAIWLAVNIVLPVALLNSALALTILALCYKERKTLFASLALVGGCYMLIDISNGWFSANFVNNVVGNPVWITCFVYLNAAAIGLSVWFLVQPIWANAKKIDASDKKKSLLLMGVSILLVASATSTIPLVYHRIQNPFLNDFKTKEVYYDVPSIKARVISFRFYESGVADLPPEARNYGSIFTMSQIRSVNWEVDFEYPPAPNRVDFTLKAIWYRSDGSILTEQTVQTHTETGWKNSEHHSGYGSNELGGFWQRGAYRVELYADGKKIAEKPFEVRLLGDKKTKDDKPNLSNEAVITILEPSWNYYAREEIFLGTTYFGNTTSFGRHGDSNHALALISDYPTYRALATKGLIKIDNLSLSDAPPAVLSSAKIDRAATVTLTQAGAKLGNVDNKANTVTFVLGTYRIEKIESNTAVDTKEGNYRLVQGIHVFDIGQNFGDVWSETGKPTYRERKFRVLFKYDPTEVKWKVATASNGRFTAEDIGPRSGDFESANVPPTLDQLRLKHSYKVTGSQSYGNGAGWYVIGFGSRNSSEAERESERRKREGFSTQVAYSSDWANFNPGWYITVYGIYEDKESAREMEKSLKARRINVYVKYSGRRLN